MIVSSELGRVRKRGKNLHSQVVEIHTDQNGIKHHHLYYEMDDSDENLAKNLEDKDRKSVV